MRYLKLYVQPEGADTTVMLGEATLGAAQLLLRILKVKPPGVEIPAAIGVVAPGGRFMEFSRIGEDRYVVRYEDPEEGVSAIGSMSLSRALECLESFFLGKEKSVCLPLMERW